MGDTGGTGMGGHTGPVPQRPPGASFTIEYLLSGRGDGAAPSPEPPGRSSPAAPRPPPEPGDKPAQSYIALISTAILSSPEKKLLLSDIYQWIMDNYPYFKNKVREGQRGRGRRVPLGSISPGFHGLGRAEPRVLLWGVDWAGGTHPAPLSQIHRENASVASELAGSVSPGSYWSLLVLADPNPLGRRVSRWPDPRAGFSGVPPERGGHGRAGGARPG